MNGAELSEAEKAILFKIKGGQWAAKMRGTLSDAEQDQYRVISRLFEKGLINPVARLKAGCSAFALTPKGAALLEAI